MQIVPFNRNKQDMFDDFFFGFPMFMSHSDVMHINFNDHKMGKDKPVPDKIAKMNKILKCDVRENEKEYEIRADFPGVAREDIDVVFDSKKNVLSISYEHNAEKNEKDNDGKWTFRERSFCSKKRDFVCPDTADANAITASLVDGVLTVKVGKREKPEGDDKQVVKIS